MASNIVEIQLLLLMAGSCLAGTNFRVSSATMVATEGSPVSVQCRFTYRHDNRYFVWLYVPPDGQGAMKKLLYWEPGSQEPIFPAGSTDHYLGTKNVNRGTMSLQISRAMSSDASRYFCQITDNLWDVNATDWCGCGISLTVERIRPPIVQLLAPFLDGAVWSATATFICKAVGFYPEKIFFRWLADSKLQSLPMEQDEPVRSSDGTYNAVSRIHIPFLEWDQIRSVRCLVTHVSKGTPFVKLFQRTTVPAPQPPITFLLRPLGDPSGDGASVTLTCGATGFYPVPVSFSWEVEGRPEGSGVWNTEPVRTPSGTYLAISTLNTPQLLWSSGARYTCLITHQELDQPIRKNISLYDCDPATCASSPTSDQSLTTPLTTVSMEIDWTTADRCQPTWHLWEISWLWVAAAVAALVIYTGIVLCIFHGISTCWQKRRGSIPESLWVNTDIPMEKMPEDFGKGEVAKRETPANDAGPKNILDPGPCRSS